ncbi:MAG: hypothetical protein WCQ00_02290 [bacterium]
MIKRLLQKVGLMKTKPNIRDSFSGFFRNASKKELMDFYKEVIRGSNADQRKVIEEADRILAERARNA